MTTSPLRRQIPSLRLSLLLALVIAGFPSPLTPLALQAADNPKDPLAEIYAAELPSSVEFLMAQFRRERKYQASDFPMEPEAFRRFQEDVISGWTSSLGLEDWVVRNPTPGKRSPIADKFKDRIVKHLTLESGVAIEAHVIEILATGDQIPVVICLPPAKDKGEEPLPGVVCCPGHSNNALRDLVFDPKSYQRAIAVRLAEAGLAAVAIEKVDSGYLSRSAPSGVDEEAITTFRLGLGTDTTRAVQLMATLAATEILATHEPRGGGCTGVRLGIQT
jgi:hypothetical protein